jgi:hypothetical protein
LGVAEIALADTGIERAGLGYGADGALSLLDHAQAEVEANPSATGLEENPWRRFYQGVDWLVTLQRLSVLDRTEP